MSGTKAGGETIPAVGRLFETAFASLPGEIAVIDRAGTIIAVNDAWARRATRGGGSRRATGIGANYLEVCARSAKQGDAQAAYVLDGLRAVLRGHKSRFVMDYHCREKWYEMVAAPLRDAKGGAVISHLDIRRRRRAEQESSRLLDQLSHIERVSLLGELTASLAHELRQPLSVVATNAAAGQVLLEAVEPAVADLRSIFADIRAAGLRAGEIVRRLRLLFLKKDREHQPVDVNSLIVETCDLARLNDRFADVSIRLRLAHDLPRVVVDRVQIQQVLLNLIYNAVEAMRTVDHRKRQLLVRSIEKKRSMIVIGVADTGPGVAPHDVERIFDAFVSNKAEGLGIGLHVSRAIVTAHGGRIWAQPRRTAGAEFCFALPVKADLAKLSSKRRLAAPR